MKIAAPEEYDHIPEINASQDLYPSAAIYKQAAEQGNVDAMK